MTKINAYTDPVKFVEAVTDAKLQDWQKDMLREMAKGKPLRMYSTGVSTEEIVRQAHARLAMGVADARYEYVPPTYSVDDKTIDGTCVDLDKLQLDNKKKPRVVD